MPTFFTKFPLLTYDLTGDPAQSPITVRNVFFRLKILDTIRQNTLIYYPYYVKDGETPEIIAYKYYKDIEKHWLVMFANQIVDPQYDWPLDYNSFINYLGKKYGGVGLDPNIGIDNAQTTIHHYELSKQRTDSATGTTTETIIILDASTYANTPQQTIYSVNMTDGTTVHINESTRPVYCYEYETNLNESKRQINLISKDYLDQISAEFDQLTKPRS